MGNEGEIGKKRKLLIFELGISTRSFVHTFYMVMIFKGLEASREDLAI